MYAEAEAAPFKMAAYRAVTSDFYPLATAHNIFSAAIRVKELFLLFSTIRARMRLVE